MNELKTEVRRFLRSQVVIGERLVCDRPMLMVREHRDGATNSLLYSINDDEAPEESD